MRTSDPGEPPRPHVRAVPPDPPHDLTLEREILHSCMMYPELLDEAHLEPGDFYKAQNGEVYAALLSMQAAGETINPLAVRSHLHDTGALKRIGGEDYWGEVTASLPHEKGLPFRKLRKLARTRDIERVAHTAQQAARANENVDGAVEAFAKAALALSEVETPTEHPLCAAWQTLEALGGLTEEPPPRQWLISRYDEEQCRTVGVLALGKVGMLIAKGGAGKTIALITLALAVATGRRWLNHFDVPEKGRVLIALAEEDAEEVRRRFFALGRAMCLTDAQIAEARRAIVCLPLAGVPVALVDAEGNDSAALLALRKQFARDNATPWRLIILDPLSRFAAGDTEKDNAAATRFIQAVESLAIAAPGRPSVLVAHHTSKVSRTAGTQASAGNARGASGLSDGARWAAELASLGDDGAVLTVVKSNYAPEGPPLTLVREAHNHGYLRAATAEERRAQAAAREAERAEQKAEFDAQAESGLHDRIVDLLTREPNHAKSWVAIELRVRPQTVNRAIDALVAAGRLRLTSKFGYSATASDACEPQKGRG